MALQPSSSRRRSERQARRTRETRERIFRAAIELFAERGIDSVTVEQITERADVGKGTFFNYFPSKTAVLTYFGGSQVERLKAALESGGLPAAPRARAHRILRLLADHPGLTCELARALFIAFLRIESLPSFEGPQIWEVCHILADVVREGQAAGVFRRDVSGEAAAQFLLGQHFLALLLWCTGFSHETLPEITDRLARLALDSLAPCLETPSA